MSIATAPRATLSTKHQLKSETAGFGVWDHNIPFVASPPSQPEVNPCQP